MSTVQSILVVSIFQDILKHSKLCSYFRISWNTLGYPSCIHIQGRGQGQGQEQGLSSHVWVEPENEASLYHGCTWLYPLCDSPWLYSMLAWLYVNLPDFTSLFHGYITSLYMLPCFYFILATSIYHGSTWLYLILLYFTMPLLGSTSLFYGCTSFNFTLPCLAIYSTVKGPILTLLTLLDSTLLYFSLHWMEKLTRWTLHHIYIIPNVLVFYVVLWHSSGGMKMFGSLIPRVVSKNLKQVRENCQYYTNHVV